MSGKKLHKTELRNAERIIKDPNVGASVKQHYKDLIASHEQWKKTKDK